MMEEKSSVKENKGDAMKLKKLKLKLVKSGRRHCLAWKSGRGEVAW